MSGQQKNPEIEITPPEEPPGFPLTKEFLEIAFEKEVDSFTVNIGTNPGDNYLSIIHALEVVFIGEKDPKYYLIKCYPNHPGRREFLDQVNVFDKELFMYEDFLQQLQNVAKESGAPHVALSLAPFHGGNVIAKPSEKFNMEPWSKENFIIMTDLRKTQGCRMADRMEGLDQDHACLVLQEIAKIHALSWALKQKEGIELFTTKYPSFIDQMYSNNDLVEQFKTVMDQIKGNALKAVEESLGSDNPAFVNFKNFLDADMMDVMKKFTLPDGIDEDLIEGYLRAKPKEDKDYNKEPWLVGTHGDCWINNMLFEYDDSQPPKPKKVTLVDFQIFREACPTIDLAYFLSNSVRAPFRIPRLDELLQVYYDAFISTCDALNVRPLPGFTFANLKRRYNRAKLFGLIVSLPLLSIVLKPPEESIDLDKAEGEGMNELFSSVLEGSNKNTKFRDELTATVLDLYENGVI